MILNILHRPDSPERAHLFELEQQYAHENGIRTTILLTPEALHDRDQVATALRHQSEFGDELGLSFHGLTHESIVDLVGYGQEALWLFSLDQKRAIVSALASRFREVIGTDPLSVASYHLDSSTMAIVRELMPSVVAAVAGCFEEGVRVFHGCNHSWYLFNEGMPWGPWYPSKSHTLRPARDEDDWCGIVAVPHLMRDMVLSYEGRNDFWASHPPNVMRGMGYEGEDCPYDRNLIDLFRWQEQFNDGYSYYNSFVSTAWLAEHHAIDDRPEVAQSLYRQQLEYLGKLKKEDSVNDMTMSEFATWFRSERRIGSSELYFAKELLYGSRKHYVWYLDPDQRLLIDATQSGSIGDLRPYTGAVPVATGPESEQLAVGSYPFLVQSQHRTGMQNHFQDGSRTTAILHCGGLELDLGTCPTRVGAVTRKADVTVATLEPVTASLAGTQLSITTAIEIRSGGRTRFRRTISWEGTIAEISLTERIKCAPGTTEYPERMDGVRGAIMKSIETTTDGDELAPAESSLDYGYRGRSLEAESVSAVRGEFPSVNTAVELAPADGQMWRGLVEEGHLYSPYLTLSLTRLISRDQESAVCLQLSSL